MLWTVILVPISIVLVFIAKRWPHITEISYSLAMYRYISQPLSYLTGLFPFSLGEVIFYGFILLSLICIIKIMVLLFSNNMKLTVSLIKKIGTTLSVLFFLFITMWGLNYYRLPLSESMSIEIKDYSKDELVMLTSYLIDKVNSFREEINEDSRGVMRLSQGKRKALYDAYSGYNNLSKEYPIFKGNYGKPKIVITSKLMSYAGIAGIFFPFTIEANVNGDLPDPLFPSNVAHEMAHQRGFAREDEANFISYLSCIYNNNIEYKYSGTLMALIHSMNALYKVDINSAKSLASQYSPGVRRDLDYINSYWKKYEGPVERTSTKINNAYLKANDQKDGIQSYGRMVDLLLAYYKKGFYLEAFY